MGNGLGSRLGWVMYQQRQGQFGFEFGTVQLTTQTKPVRVEKIQIATKLNHLKIAQSGLFDSVLVWVNWFGFLCSPLTTTSTIIIRYKISSTLVVDQGNDDDDDDEEEEEEPIETLMEPFAKEQLINLLEGVAMPWKWPIESAWWLIRIRCIGRYLCTSLDGI